MSSLSTKCITLTLLCYAMKDSNRGPFSSKTFVTLALAGVLHWVVVAITLVLGFKVWCWHLHGIPFLVKPSFTVCNSAIPTLDTDNNETSSPSKPNEVTDTLQPVSSCPAFSFMTECWYWERVTVAALTKPKVDRSKGNQTQGGLLCHR